MAAVMALALSGLLVLAMTGVFIGIGKGFTATIERSSADIIIMQPGATSLMGGPSGVPRRFIPLAYNHPEVVEVMPLDGAGGTFQNIKEVDPTANQADKARQGAPRQKFVQASIIDTRPGSVTIPTDYSQELVDALRQPYTVAVDETALTTLGVKLGDKVKQGSVVLVLEAEGAAAAPVAAPAAASMPAPAAAPVAAAPAPVAAAAPAATGPVEVRVPDIGDFKDVAVIELLVKPGDTVKAEQSLITVESDKASMEIPSSHAGVLKELKVKVGDTVNIGDLLAILEGSVAAASAAATPVSAPAAAPAPPTVELRDPGLVADYFAADPATQALVRQPDVAPVSSVLTVRHSMKQNHPRKRGFSSFWKMRQRRTN